MGGVVGAIMGSRKKKSAPAPAPVPEPEVEAAPQGATREQRAQAASLRSRRAGRRSLLGGGRLGGGEGEQTTLGAG
jgi:hypothetical protein